jgi:xylose isomerase
MSYYETTLAKDYGTVGIQSGKQERLDNLVNQYLMGL